MTNQNFNEEIIQMISQPTLRESMQGEELLKFIAQPVPPEPNELLLAIEKELTKNPQSREVFAAILKKHGL